MPKIVKYDDALYPKPEYWGKIMIYNSPTWDCLYPFVDIIRILPKDTIIAYKFGKNQENGAETWNLALDRIKSLEEIHVTYRQNETDWDFHFSSIYGVSKPFDKKFVVIIINLFIKLFLS